MRAIDMQTYLRTEGRAAHYAIVILLDELSIHSSARSRTIKEVIRAPLQVYRIFVGMFDHAVPI